MTRQNLSGLIGRMERHAHVAIAPDGKDRRSRVVAMTESGRPVWQALTLPKFHTYDQEILGGFSINAATPVLHYLLEMLENMQRLDHEWVGAADDDAGPAWRFTPRSRRIGMGRLDARAAPSQILPSQPFHASPQTRRASAVGWREEEHLLSGAGQAVRDSGRRCGRPIVEISPSSAVPPPQPQRR